MRFNSFLLQLGLVILINVILLWPMYTFLPIGDYIGLSVAGMVFFISLSLIVFIAARRLTQSKNLNDFTRLIMANMMAKLFLSIAIVAIYYKMVEPTERYFVLPFIVIYLIFTIFEAIFLSKLARQQ